MSDNGTPLQPLSPKPYSGPLGPRRQKLLSLGLAAAPETGHQSGERLKDVLGRNEVLVFGPWCFLKTL